jgi:L-lactate dehydrogenase complex protein LldF
VKIPLHDMLVHLRRRYVESGKAPLLEKAAMAGFAQTMGSAKLYNSASKLGRLIPINVVNAGAKTAPLSGWTKSREMPKLAKRPLRDKWDVIGRADDGQID